MRKFFKHAAMCAFIFSCSIFSDCQAEISKKKLEKFSYKAEHIFSKLLSSREKKDSDKMFEYVLEIKKEFDKAYKVRVILDDFFDYACERIEQSGCVLTDQQKAALEKGYKIKRDYNFHHHLSVKKPSQKEDYYEVPTPLAYGFSLTLCGLLFQATQIPMCLMYGPVIEARGIEECQKFLIKEIPVQPEIVNPLPPVENI